MAQVEGAVEAGGQTVLEEAQQAALAGAGLAGDGADAAGVDQKLSGGEVAFDGGQEVELVDRDLLGEGQSGEVEVAQQFAVVVHRDCSWERSDEGLTVTREAASEAAAGGQRIVRRVRAARHRGAAGVVVIVAGGIKAEVGAAHPSVGVGVDQARLADVAPAVVNEQAAVARRQGRVVAQDDAFADQGGRQLEQDAVGGDGGVAVDLAGGPGGGTPLPG